MGSVSKQAFGSNLRGVASDAVRVGAELGVLDTVYFDHVHRWVVHAVVFVCQLVPGGLQSLAVAAPEHNRI